MLAVGSVVDGGDWLDQEIEMARGVQEWAHALVKGSTGALPLPLSCVHWPPRLIVERRLGALSRVQRQRQPKKMLFAWLSGWVRGRRARGGAVGSARCPWGPACACDGGPAFQRLFLGSPRSVRSAERPLDKNAVRPSLSSPLPSCQLREVRHPSIPFLPSFGLVPATDGAVLNPASRRRLAAHAL